MWRAGVIDCHCVQCSLTKCRWWLLCVSAPTVSGEGSWGGVRGIHIYIYIIRGPTFFLNRSPAWSKSGPVCMTIKSRADLVGRDLRQQLWLANIDACKTHARNICLIPFHVRCADGLMGRRPVPGGLNRTRINYRGAAKNLLSLVESPGCGAKHFCHDIGAYFIRNFSSHLWKSRS